MKKTELHRRIERYLRLLSAEAAVDYVTYAIKEPLSIRRHADDGVPNVGKIYLKTQSWKDIYFDPEENAKSQIALNLVPARNAFSLFS